MSKKSFTLFIIVLLGVIGFLAWYFLFRGAPQGPGNTATSTPGDLFPFGQGPVATSSTSTSGSIEGNTIIDLSGGNNVSVPKLRQLWKDPTAGEGFLSSGTTTLAVRFVDRATGHIYEAPVDSLGDTQLSNVTIPQIYEALISSNGNEMLMRYLTTDNAIQSFYARLSTSTNANATSTALDGYFLPQNIRDISLLGNKILYFDPALTTGSLTQANIDGTKRVSLMNTDLRDWTISWNATSTVFLSTRPSGAVNGHGYLFNIPTGSIVKIVDSIPGLTGTMSPLGQYVFLSGQNNTTVASAVYDVVGKKTTTLSVSTLSDKCAWSNTQKSVIYCGVPVNITQGTYPDDWYQGTMSFSDALWQIDVATGETTLISDPTFDASTEMDMEKMAVDPTDSYITFINKKDMSLWLYKI